MTKPREGNGTGIAVAFINTISESLRTCDGMGNQREARHRIGVLAEITRGARQTIGRADLTMALRTRMGEAIREGRQVSARTKRICIECDDLYLHQPPDTTEETCDYCTAETVDQEEDEKE